MDLPDAPAAAQTAPPRDGLLWILSYANFVVGMGAFVVIGVLSPVAADLSITKAQAASLLTVYAIVYAVASPLLVAVTGSVERVWALATAMAVFGVGSVAAALSADLTGVLVGRGVMAAGAGIVTPVAATVGVALSGPQRRGRALAVVFGGLTLAQALGVPLGAWLGYAYGWRSAFGLVSVLAAFATVAFVLWVPRHIAVPVATLAALRSVLSSLPQSRAVAFTALFIAALYVPYTFLAPLLESRFQLGRDGVTLVLAIFGVGAVVGNSMGGVLTDRIGALPTLALLCVSQVVLMPLLTLLAVPLVAFCALVALWSVCSWSFMVPQQARLAQIDPQRIPVLFALNAAAIYVGGSLGSALGGYTLRTAGLAALGAVGGVIALLALASLYARRPT